MGVQQNVTCLLLWLVGLEFEQGFWDALNPMICLPSCGCAQLLGFSVRRGIGNRSKRCFCDGSRCLRKVIYSARRKGLIQKPSKANRKKP